MKGFNLLRRGDPSGAGLPRRSSLNPNPPAGGLTVNQSADFTSFNHADIYSLNILCPCMSLIVFPGALRQNKYQISQNELVSNRWHVFYKMKRLRGAHEGASSNPVSDRHTGDQFLHYIKHKPRTLLRERNANSNHYEVHIPVVFGRQFFLDKELYCRSAPRKPRIPEEHPIDKAERFLSLMERNKWTQADLAKHLGISRARVTQVLNVLKIPKVEIDRMKNKGVRITERVLRNL